MIFEVKNLDEDRQYVGRNPEDKWAVVCLDEDTVWERYATQEEAENSAAYYQNESDAMDYIRDELEQIVMQGPHRFMDFSQSDFRDLVRRVADDGGY